MTDLKVGDKIQSFKLAADDNSEIDLSNYLGKKNIILYFYPKDDTPGCTQEAKDFTSLHDQFIAKDAIILGVSKDGVKSHEKFKNKYEIPYNLLADTELELCKYFNVYVQKSMFGKKYMGLERATYLINKKGEIANIWRKVKVTNHAQDVLNNI